MKEITIAVNSENVEYVDNIRVYNVKLPPIGVSQWKEYGKLYGYWDYFIDLEHKRLQEKIRLRMIEEANTPLDKRKSGWDILIEVRDEIIKSQSQCQK